MRAELFNADGQTDKHEDNSRLSQLCERAYKHGVTLPKTVAFNVASFPLNCTGRAYNIASFPPKCTEEFYSIISRLLSPRMTGWQYPRVSPPPSSPTWRMVLTQWKLGLWRHTQTYLSITGESWMLLGHSRSSVCVSGCPVIVAAITTTRGCMNFEKKTILRFTSKFKALDRWC